MLFSLTAIALYGYDQGIIDDTNFSYLDTMGIGEESPSLVSSSPYTTLAAPSAVFFSWFADRYGRKRSIFLCLATASIGNVIMFLASGIHSGSIGGHFWAGSLWVLGSEAYFVIPIYNSELANDEARGGSGLGISF